MIEIEIKKFDDYKKVFKYILDDNSSKVILFNGNLGSGKTTLIQLICQKLNIKDKVLSPTFNLINEYKTKHNLKVYHFDLYRIKSIEELIDIDFIEYVYSGNYCFIEWPNICVDIIDIEYKEIFIDVISEDKRLIRIS
jgi:tRNA threonylcarbamoyladenosine biosynthesis protein TsaE|tara:strand:- start:1287 stop:1700 length:414 start_codon:yes stop_codon:yes gene_type:complete